jgi:hypothetical protein
VVASFTKASIVLLIHIFVHFFGGKLAKLAHKEGKALSAAQKRADELRRLIDQRKAELASARAAAATTTTPESSHHRDAGVEAGTELLADGSVDDDSNDSGNGAAAAGVMGGLTDGWRWRDQRTGYFSPSHAMLQSRTGHINLGPSAIVNQTWSKKRGAKTREQRQQEMEVAAALMRETKFTHRSLFDVIGHLQVGCCCCCCCYCCSDETLFRVVCVRV